MLVAYNQKKMSYKIWRDIMKFISIYLFYFQYNLNPKSQKQLDKILALKS